jgi:hypothetical protein
MDYFNVDTNAQTGEVTIIPYTPEQIAQAKQQEKESYIANNKQQAKDLLAQTDWTTIADVTNPALSNPYLANSADFIDYRNQLRAIVFNPPDTEIVFPVIPVEDWQSV